MTNPEATAHLERALKIDEGLGRREGVADHIRDLGVCAGAQGDPLRAVALLQGALAIEEKIGHLQRQITCILALGSVLGDLGRYEPAAGCFAHAITLAGRAGLSNDDPKVLALRMGLQELLGEARRSAARVPFAATPPRRR